MIFCKSEAGIWKQCIKCIICLRIHPSVLNSVIWFVVKCHLNVGTHDASTVGKCTYVGEQDAYGTSGQTWQHRFSKLCAYFRLSMMTVSGQRYWECLSLTFYANLASILYDAQSM